MPFRLRFTKEASLELLSLKDLPALAKHFKAVRKALGYLEVNVRHPSLKTHKYDSFKGLNGADVFEAYAENNAPGAYRIFWQYGPEQQALTVLGIEVHPD